MDVRLKALLRLKAEQLELTIHEMEVMSDHVPLFVEGGPRICVAEIVNGLKGFTSHELGQQFPFLNRDCPRFGAEATMPDRSGR